MNVETRELPLLPHKGRRTRAVPLLVPDELANLVRSIVQQDAGEFKQDDFNHGHGGCEWVTASMRILFQSLDNGLSAFFVHDDSEQFSIVMENSHTVSAESYAVRFAVVITGSPHMPDQPASERPG